MNKQKIEFYKKKGDFCLRCKKEVSSFYLINNLCKKCRLKEYINEIL